MADLQSSKHQKVLKETFSVAKATLESLMSLEGVVILNLRCGYIENGVVILSVRS